MKSMIDEKNSNTFANDEQKISRADLFARARSTRVSR